MNEINIDEKQRRMKQKPVKKSDSFLIRYVSAVLQKPGPVGLELDAKGWADTKELLEVINNQGYYIDMPILERVVDRSARVFNEDKTKIRAFRSL